MPDLAATAQTGTQTVAQIVAQIVGEKNILTDPDSMRPYLRDLRNRYQSKCRAVVLPRDVDEVAAVVKWCAKNAIGIVPQGGNSGAVGGAVADESQIILNLARLNKLGAVDADNYTLTAQAGCILADIHAHAEAHNRFFPLNLGARGSCQIGGNLATNAGGMNVLRYGNARDLALGLEVVLANGEIWRDMNFLRKDNSGYDLKNLFIGSEGTLGIITAAALKLFPLPTMRVVALAGAKRAEDCLTLLARLREASDDRLSTFELMADIAVQSAIRHIPTQSAAMTDAHRWYVLLAADGNDQGLRAHLETALAAAIDDDLVQDAVLAENDRQAQQLAALRENVVAAQQFEGGSIKHDVSVPLTEVPQLLREAKTAILREMPDARPYFYGHLGDGNMHLNITQPQAMDTDTFLSHWQKMNDIVHDITANLHGSFSAEHGVGLARLAEMKRHKDAVSLALYAQLKRALDPQNVLNAGKVVGDAFAAKKPCPKKLCPKKL